MLMVYNSLTRKKEEFRPLEDNIVKMYVCGPTVYDYCHIGHARSFIAFDTIRRYLEFKGYKVIYVQNFTDIDDKMIKRAKQENKEVFELAEYFINAYFEDTTPLNLKRADYYPRATSMIPEMIEIIKVLIEKGFAYEIDGNVYFDVMKFPDYGKLAGINIEEHEAQRRCKFIDYEKKHDKDFALWKKKKEGEPSWWSPWGYGRPGWHIECSAMSIKYLGEQIDIHGGGNDLIFPHHQNEIAQSEAFSGKKPFVKYWLHNGFVNINSEKMSKSLGNFITIREALQKYPAEALRFLLVSTHYRKPIDFSEAQINTAIRTLNKFYQALDFLEQFEFIIEQIKDISIRNNLTEVEKTLLEQVENEFIEAMDNDFDTHNAIAAIMKLIKYINGKMGNPENFSHQFIKNSFKLILKLTEVLGLFENYRNPSKNRQNLHKLIQYLISLRTEYRKNKEFDLADKIRDVIKEIGYTIKDFKNFSLYQKLN